MILRLCLAFCIWLLASGGSITTAQLRIVSYNTATGESNGQPTSPRPGLEVVLAAIGDEEVGGIQRPIDVLALQEQSSASTTTQEIVDILNNIYGAGVYRRANVNGDTWGAGRPGLIYNSQTVQLTHQKAFGALSSNGGVRQNLRYRLRPVGYDNAADFYVYNSHYKASTGDENIARRNVEAQTVRQDADALGEDVHIIYLGDFNIQSSSEPMYQTLLAAGAGQAIDPIDAPGTWHNSSRFVELHTQSPADGSVASLITGGVDDRFDFQIASGEFLDGDGLSYIPGSYHVFGNNGTHGLNNAINSRQNSAQPATVLNALARVADHLPVVADYQLPARMDVAFSGVPPSRVIIDAPVSVEVQVSNTAPVEVPHGADELAYVVATNGVAQGEFRATATALSEINRHFVSLDTSSLGTARGQINVTSTSQAVSDEFTLPLSYTVLDHAVPSFDRHTIQTEFSIDFGIVALGERTGGLSGVFNIGSADSAVGLDLEQIQSSGANDLGLSLAPFTALSPGDGSIFSIGLQADTLGQIAATWELLFSDEDLPGAQTTTLTLSASARVALPGDANLDGRVDGSDFNIWNDHQFTVGSSWTTADFNHDGRTDAADYEIISRNLFGGGGENTNVPEPPAVLLGLIACFGMWCRRRCTHPSCQGAKVADSLRESANCAVRRMNHGTS